MATRQPTANERITAAIETQLQNGVIPWTKPWVTNSCGIVSHETGRPYSLNNRMLLQYGGEYATFHQIKMAGGSVKKGEKSQTVFFAKYLDKTDDTGEVVGTYYFLKAYAVFRVGTQTEGVEPKYEHIWGGGGLPKDDGDVLTIIRSYCDRSGVKMILAGAKAFYCQKDDTIQVPGCNTFSNRSQFWHTVFHELAHSTGSPERLKRPTANAFGVSKYATEELVADIAACLCLGRLNLDTTECIRNSAGYIQSWHKHIHAFKSTDFSDCVRKAEQACDYIFNINTRNKE